MPQDILKLFGPTGGSLITLLRAEPRTVNDLAQLLELTDNAVRSHLAGLVSDGWIVMTGTKKGSRKPHNLYDLAPKTQRLLSAFYVPVLSTLVAVLREHHSQRHLDEVLCGIGHRLAESHHASVDKKPLKTRINYALKILTDLGGIAEAHKEKGKWLICVKGCSLGEIVTSHPPACRLKETLIGDLLGEPVKHQCTQGERPECCFVIGV